MTEVGVIEKPQHTPNFIREMFRQDIEELRPFLLQMAAGLVELPVSMCDAVKKGKVPGAIVIAGQPYQVAAVSQRLDAIKTHIQTGVGYRSDHTTDDEPLRRQVVIMPPWQDEIPNAPAKGALTDGKSTTATDDPTNGRRAGGNGGGGS